MVKRRDREADDPGDQVVLPRDIDVYITKFSVKFGGAHLVTNARSPGGWCMREEALRCGRLGLDEPTMWMALPQMPA